MNNIKDFLRLFVSISIISIKRNWQTYRKNKYRNKLSNSIIQNYYSNNQIRKLQIGFGSNLLEGWLNTDLIYNNSDAFLDVTKKIGLLSGEFDYVYSEHVIEHLTYE